MNICPGYWSWLDLQLTLSQVGSIVMVADELKAGKDELVDWVNARPQHFILNDDAPTQAHFANIANLVASGNYNKGNSDNFLQKADPWIIAKAKTIGATVVTHELLVKDPLARKVKVPNICGLYGVPYIDPFSLLRFLKARFIL